MKKKLFVQVTMAAYCTILVLSQLLLAADGGRVPIYIGLAALAVVLLFLGEKAMRFVAGGALLLAIILAIWDYQLGVRLQARVRTIQRNTTNSVRDPGSVGLTTTTPARER